MLTILVAVFSSFLIQCAADQGDNTDEQHGCTFHGLSAKCRVSTTLELMKFVRQPSDVVHL